MVSVERVGSEKEKLQLVCHSRVCIVYALCIYSNTHHSIPAGCAVVFAILWPAVDHFDVSSVFACYAFISRTGYLMYSIAEHPVMYA